MLISLRRLSVPFCCLMPLLLLAQARKPDDKKAEGKPEELTLPLSIVRNGTTGVIEIKRLGMMSVLTWADKTSIKLVARNVEGQLGKDAAFKLQLNGSELPLVFEPTSGTLAVVLKRDQLPPGANTLRVTFVDKGDKKMVSSPTLAWMVN